MPQYNYTQQRPFGSGSNGYPQNGAQYYPPPNQYSSSSGTRNASVASGSNGYAQTSNGYNSLSAARQDPPSRPPSVGAAPLIHHAEHDLRIIVKYAGNGLTDKQTAIYNQWLKAGQPSLNTTPADVLYRQGLTRLGSLSAEQYKQYMGLFKKPYTGQLRK